MNGRRAILFLQTATGAMVVLLASWLFIPEKFLYAKLFSEDGFYSLTVAKNIAEGHGVVIDGSTLTNGFQPLFTLVCVIPFLLAGDNLALAFQILYVIHLVIFVATAWVVARCIRFYFGVPDQKAVFWTAMFLYISSLYLFSHHTNALETGLLMLLYALIWRFLQSYGDHSVRSFVLLGMLFGFLVLTRIDAGFFCASFAVVHLWHDRFNDFYRALREIAISAMVALIISSPWWLYNIIVFGSPMPTSGVAEQDLHLSVERLIRGVFAVSQNLVPFVEAGRYDSVVVDIARLVIVLIAVIVGLKNGKNVFSDTSKFFTSLFWSMLLLAIWYVTTSYAEYFYERYLLPVVLFSLYGMVRLCHASRWNTTLLMVVAIPMFVFLGRAYMSRSYDTLDHFYLDTNPMHRLVQRNVPMGEMLASGQSGFIGFMRSGVVNLDGKVNAEALAYRDSIPTYLDKKNIRWFCDDSISMVRYGFTDPRRFGWKLKGKERHFFLYAKTYE